MGRPNKGWRLRAPDGRKRRRFSVLFWLDGAQVERSTGHTNRRKAESAARRIYARAVQESVSRGPRRPRVTTDKTLEGLADAWIASRKGTLVDDTRLCYLGYLTGNLIPFFERLDGITSARVEQYRSIRLGQVTGASVNHELTCLRGWVKWLRLHGHLSWDVKIERVPKSVEGTRTGGRVKAPPLSVAEVMTWIAHLPERSKQGRLVRPRFEFLYETGLRLSFVERLSVPQHWTPGSDVLTIDRGSDKKRFGRVVPLSEKARAILEAYAPKAGPVFGRYKHVYVMRRSAVATFKDEAKGQKVCAAHLRSARITHMLRAGCSLPGTQWNVGHTTIQTTAGYVESDLDAGREALVSMADNPRALLARVQTLLADAHAKHVGAKHTKPAALLAQAQKLLARAQAHHQTRNTERPQ